MSKLSKRAISTLVIAILLISTIASILPMAAAADLTLVTATPTLDASGESTTYTIAFTTATVDGVIATVDMAFPAGFDVSGAVLGAVTGLDAGTIGVAAQVVTYTVTVPALVPISTAVSIELITIVNTETPGSAYTVSVTTNTAVPGIIDGPTASTAFTIVQAQGTLSITTLPFINGEVLVDGSPWGPAPASQVVDVGTYTVSFGPVLDYVIPDPQEAVVTYNTETAVLGTYFPTTPGFSIDIVLPPGVAVYGDPLTVKGSGVTSGSTVELYWDFVTAASQLNTTTGLASGDFECEVKVASANYGDHYIWAKDLATGLSARSGPISVVPKITLSPSSGLRYDDITIKGYGFSEDSEITFVYQEIIDKLSDDTGKDETDDLGYFEYIFEVDATLDDTYTVTATDAAIHSASADFIVGAAITLDKTVGPAGTKVKIDGRGFTDEVDITIASITLENGDSYEVATSDDDDEDLAFSDGTFSVYIIIPSALEGTYDVTVTDSGTVPKTASAEFEVDGETSITVTPGYGTPGTVLTVKGYNFTQVSGTKVDLTLMEQEAEATTDASGSFTATIVVPPLDFGVRYPVTAKDVRNCEDSELVLVALIVLQLSEYSAPVGSEIMLMGSGFTKGAENGKWNATIGDIDLIETIPVDTEVTYFSHYWYVPSLPAGTYTINVRDIEEDIEVGIDFTVTAPAELSVSRAAIPKGYNLTIEGTNFYEKVDQKTEWWIYNSTDAWNIDDNVSQGNPLTPTKPPLTDEDGEFTAWYLIPEFLELGSYCINCTTVSNTAVDPDIIQTAEVCVELVPEEIVINVGGPSYARGQTITFVIKTTLKKDPFDLGIKDPEGSEVFNSTWHIIDWKTLGSWFYIPSNLQIDVNTEWLYTLPTDAIPGTWTYSFWDDNKEYANGTFQVTQLTEIEQLQQDIGELTTGMEGIGTSIIDLATTVAGVSGASAEAVAAAAAAAAAATEAQAAAEAGIAAIDDMSEIAQDAVDAANNAVSAADAAKDAADAGLAAALNAQTTSQAAVDAAQTAAEAAEANQRTTSGLTTLVYGAIGASLIAALAAIVSLMQISRRIAG